MDWIIDLWQPAEQGAARSERISPGAPREEEELRLWVQERLPGGHRVLSTKFWDPNLRPPPDPRAREFYSNPENLVSQYWLLEQQSLRAAQLHLDHSLWCRARADTGMERSPPLRELRAKIRENTLLMPDNERRGPWRTCDQWYMGPALTVFRAMQLGREFLRLHLEGGVAYNPEYLLGAALAEQGIGTDQQSGITITLRKHGTHEPGRFYPEWGQWNTPPESRAEEQGAEQSLRTNTPL